ncbi:hypothetical protein GM661_04665 [Iocasia frigidifontis]|uniref:Uncharacterized protein n=1 Tax=Iocasia fonsfrigidae TaxID=2682810 RepID=A0A8A7K6I1_9FIRM|nr:hypothetical protein [Iocasia fonsfrigidae]QTL97326.1 hypothetical protein GM661_04665 [Iocasia fonsfrigidae]
MEEKQKKLLEKAFEIDFQKTPLEIIEELAGEIDAESKVTVEEEIIEDSKKIVNYHIDDNLNRVMILSIAAGLPTKEFLKAENIYKDREKKTEEKGDSADKTEYKYYLEGSLLCGSLAQYAAIIAEGFVEHCQAETYNSIGLKKFLRFQGNEFLGLKIGLLYYLNDLYYEQRSMMKEILYSCEDCGLIKYGNISEEYRTYRGDKLNEGKIKKVLADIFKNCLEIEEKEAADLVEEQFDPGIVERKMRFIDRYELYEKKNREKNDKIVNYIFSENIPAQLFKQIGASYLVDEGLKKYNGDLRRKSLNQLEEIEEDKLKNFKEHDFEVFEPYVLLKEDANGSEAKNRLREKPKLNQLTDKMSYDYLSSLIKDIVMEINNKDHSLIKGLFQKSYSSRKDELIYLVKDRLVYSMYHKGLLKESAIEYSSDFLRNNPDLFQNTNKIYPLDRAVIKQFEKMRTVEITALWEWKLSADGIFLILGSQIDSEEVIKYHSSTGVFNNQREEIKLELDQPSQNKIYGSHGKPANYQKIYDHDYHYKEEGAYNFSSQQGAGFIILSTHKNPEQGIKIDGRDISGQYEEKDREEANIGGRTKTLRDTYFGENIILRDKKTTYGQLSGDLVYIYGPQKEDELIIEGFQNGDYGITLREKVRQPEDDKQPVTYTAYHKVRFDCVEFVDLKEMVIEKSIYEHSRVKIAGVIKDENAEKYRDYLEKEADPRIIITYDDDDSKILFKGIINDYNIDYKYFNYYLELWAVSYTILLDRERHTRVYQNQGTSYNQVCQKLSTANEKFNINFARSSAGEVPLVSEQYPLVLQHKETDWEFINRIASYLDQVLIVDDTKDDNETINIQLGFHSAQAVELNNDNWAKCKDTGPKNIIYQYYKVYQHEHFRSDHVFEVGKKVELLIDHKNNTTVEMGIIKNKIYLQKGILYSELTLAREENIKILNKQRKFLMEGRSYRAEVREVNQKHQAQVSFIDIEDDYQTDKAHWFPIDKPYTAAYSSPDIGDIVDIYFRNKNEKYATLKSSTTDEAREIEQNPADKTIRTPGGYIIKLNNGSIYIASPEEEAVLEITAEEIKMTSSDNQVVIKKGEIELKNEKGYGKLSKTGSEIGFGKKKVEINNGKVKFI